MQEESQTPFLALFAFAIYSLFGLIVDTLWLFDFIKYGQKLYSIVGVFILIIGNTYQCFLTFFSLLKKKIIQIKFIIIYLIFLLCGISIYVSTFNSTSHFSLFTVASIITEILFSLYGITLVMSRNQKQKEILQRGQLEDASAAEAAHSSVFLYDPELPENEINSYDTNGNENSLNTSDDESELNEKKKYFIYGIKRDESFDDDSNKFCHFTYPEQIDVSDSPIAGVVDNSNPYSMKNIELFGTSVVV